MEAVIVSSKLIILVVHLWLSTFHQQKLKTGEIFKTLCVICYDINDVVLIGCGSDRKQQIVNILVLSGQVLTTRDNRYRKENGAETSDSTGFIQQIQHELII